MQAGPGPDNQATTADPQGATACPTCGRPPASSFAAVLSRLMSKYKVGANGVERITGLDHAYVSRLMRGKKCSPTIEAVHQIVFALAREGLEFGEADELVDVAGYASPYRRRYRDDPAEDVEK